jgi:hypothetical protein
MCNAVMCGAVRWLLEVPSFNREKKKVGPTCIIHYSKAFSWR